MNCTITVAPLPGEVYIRREAAEKYFKAPYKAGELVEVTFEKKDGSLRTMACKRDAFMESEVKGKMEKNPGYVSVCEEGRQWRKVNLDRITEIRI